MFWLFLYVCGCVNLGIVTHLPCFARSYVPFPLHPKWLCTTCLFIIVCLTYASYSMFQFLAQNRDNLVRLRLDAIIYPFDQIITDYLFFLPDCFYNPKNYHTNVRINFDMYLQHRAYSQFASVFTRAITICFNFSLLRLF